MQPITATRTKALPTGAYIPACDNSGAKMLKIFAVKGHKTVKGRLSAAGVGDIVYAAVKRGKPEMRKQTVMAVIVRQKKSFKRPNGMRVKFETNAAVVIKDIKGNPQGTLIKGPVAKEVCDRFPGIAKITSIMV